jgi:hypothetical protein
MCCGMSEPHPTSVYFIIFTLKLQGLLFYFFPRIKKARIYFLCIEGFGTYFLPKYKRLCNLFFLPEYKGLGNLFFSLGIKMLDNFIKKVYYI